MFPRGKLSLSHKCFPLPCRLCVRFQSLSSTFSIPPVDRHILPPLLMPFANPSKSTLSTLPTPSTHHLPTAHQPTPASTPRTHHLPTPIIAAPHKRREVVAAATSSQRRARRSQPDNVAEERERRGAGEERLREQGGVDAAGCGTEGAG